MNREELTALRAQINATITSSLVATTTASYDRIDIEAARNLIIAYLNAVKHIMS